ncbi:SBBP repeat-containing protein [bacterium]|nr:SBBP repeat-containing protein [bacterium]
MKKTEMLNCKIFLFTMILFFSNNYAQVIQYPTISYSTYIGGTRPDYFYDSCYDENGNLFLVGKADTNEVIKMNVALDSILAGVNIKSSRTTTPRKVAYDKHGNVYVVGTTNTWDLITTDNAWDDTYANNPDQGSDVFIYKYDSNLQELLYGTYFGGFNDDYIGDIYVDDNENIYVLGSTFSGMFYDNILYTSDYPRVYLAKINTVTGLLEYITFMKGDGQDRGYAMSVVNNKYIYIAGSTGSKNFPTTPGAVFTNALGPHFAYGSWDADAFIAKLDIDGGILKSTYLGGTSGKERCNDIIVYGNKLIAVGFTESNDFPISNSVLNESYHGNEDIFICVLDTDLSQITRSVLLGGEDDDNINSIIMDFHGNYCITGYTESTSYPITDNAISSTIQGMKDLFITKINEEFSSIIFSSFYGGTNNDEAKVITITHDYNLLLVGDTYSDDFPVTNNAINNEFSGIDDGFILLLNDLIDPPTVPVCNFSADIIFGDIPLNVQFSDSSSGIINEWLWDFGDGDSSNEQNPVHTYQTADTFTVSLTIEGLGGSDTHIKEKFIIATEPTNVNDEIIHNAKHFMLHQNYPNPFNPSTKIEYNVKKACKVNLVVYNLNGQVVKELVNSYQQAGRYFINLNIQDIPSGIYFYKIKMGDFQAVRRMVKIE